MKKTFMISAIIGLMVSASLTLVGQQNKKTSEARKDVKKSEAALTEAKKDSAADYQKFKNEAELKIADNKVKIKELKERKADENKETKERYDKKVLALEQKNNSLKNKIDNSETVKTTMWASFKKEFIHDMGELGDAFIDIGVNNIR